MSDANKDIQRHTVYIQTRREVEAYTRQQTDYTARGRLTRRYTKTHTHTYAYTHTPKRTQ